MKRKKKTLQPQKDKGKVMKSFARKRYFQKFYCHKICEKRRTWWGHHITISHWPIAKTICIYWYNDWWFFPSFKKQKMHDSKGNNNKQGYSIPTVLMYYFCRGPFSATILCPIYKSHYIHFCTATINCFYKCNHLFWNVHVNIWFKMMHVWDTIPHVLLFFMFIYLTVDNGMWVGPLFCYG